MVGLRHQPATPRSPNSGRLEPQSTEYRPVHESDDVTYGGSSKNIGHYKIRRYALRTGSINTEDPHTVLSFVFFRMTLRFHKCVRSVLVESGLAFILHSIKR